MAKFINDDGVEVEALTAEEAQAAQDAAIKAREEELQKEFEAKMAEKDEHQAKKLEEMEKAKGGATAAITAATTAAEEAKKMAEEAQSKIAAAEARELETKKDYWVRSVVGNDPELTKKIQEAYKLLNLPATTDLEIQERVQKAVTLAGINAINVPDGMSLGGFAAPAQQGSTTQKAADYEAWKSELGLADFVPKQQ